jgi:hypothetical protein
MEENMDSAESLLLEAMKNMLSDKIDLGLGFHGDTEERSHMTQFHWQDVEDMMRVKLNNPAIDHHESISGAFFHTHSYKNIDDPRFDLAFRKQMSGMVVPNNEQELALKYVDEIRNELDMPVRKAVPPYAPHTSSAEQSTGTPDMDGMRDATEQRAE